SLYDLLLAASPQFDPNRRNDQLGWDVVVSSADGYQAVIAWGEIDPNYGAKPVLVAYQENGQLLGQRDGMARLVVPGDGHGGRYVSNVSSISLRRAQEASMASSLAQLAPVRAYHAGSLNAVIKQDIGPAFTAASGYPFEDVGGPSVGLANQIKAGQIN